MMPHQQQHPFAVHSRREVAPPATEDAPSRAPPITPLVSPAAVVSSFLTYTFPVRPPSSTLEFSNDLGMHHGSRTSSSPVFYRVSTESPPPPAQEQRIRIPPPVADIIPVLPAPSVPRQAQHDPNGSPPDPDVSPVSPVPAPPAPAAPRLGFRPRLAPPVSLAPAPRTPVAPRLGPRRAPPASGTRPTTGGPLPTAQRPSARQEKLYHVANPSLFWLGGRPYRFHKRVGQGGFGEVCQVELLIPLGTEVFRVPPRSLVFAPNGIALRPATVTDARPRSAARPARERAQAVSVNVRQEEQEAQEHREAQPQDADMAEMLSKVSMGPPQEFLSFVLAGDHVALEDDPIPPDQNIPRADGAGFFNFEDVTLVKGSGAFFALKIQKAKNKQQLTEYVKEVGNLRKLKGCPFTVQIVDHAVNENALSLLILMELGACDLHSFLRKSLSDLSVSDVCRIWQGLLRAVNAAHTKGIIHHDIKPENFLLVPSTPFADRILATTAVSRNNFVFQMVGEDDDHDPDLHVPVEGGTMLAQDCRGDVKLFLRDPTTGREDVLRLHIKLSDFGLAQPLEVDESHLSLKGCRGTVLYMAPEMFLPVKLDGTKKVSKDVDIWALGVILFQMLHDNRTPFGACHEADPRHGVAVAASNKEMHRKVMVFERTKVWVAERKRVLLQASRNPRVAGTAGSLAERRARSEEILTPALLRAGIQTEFLFRMCELCLAFETSDRAGVQDLGRWIGTAFDEDWRTGGVSVCDERFSTPVAPRQNNLRIVGRIAAQAAFPEVWGPYLSDEDVVGNPLASSESIAACIGDASATVRTGGQDDGAAAGLGLDRATPTVPAASTLFPSEKDAAKVDLERGEAPSREAAKEEERATPTVPVTSLFPSEKSSAGMDLEERGEAPSREAANEEDMATPTVPATSVFPSEKGAAEVDLEERGEAPSREATNEEHRVTPAVPATSLFPSENGATEVDSERATADPPPTFEDEQDGASVSFRCKVFGIILLVMLGAVGLLAASIGIIRARENSQEHPTTEPQDAVRPTVVPGTTVVAPDILVPPKQPLEESAPPIETPAPFMVSWEGTMS